MKQIRKKNGFERFLLPKQISELAKAKAAHSGPVVVLNVSNIRCDALILKPMHDDIVHIPLDDFTSDNAQEMQRSLSRLLPEPHLKTLDEDFKCILAELWEKVVEKVAKILGCIVSFCKILSLLMNTTIHLQPEGSSSIDMARVWWCPTGPLTFLPIHAAGLYNGGGPKLPGLADRKSVV